MEQVKMSGKEWINFIRDDVKKISSDRRVSSLFCFSFLGMSDDTFDKSANRKQPLKTYDEPTCALNINNDNNNTKQWDSHFVNNGD